VVTTLTYDALDRLRGKNYDTSAAPSVAATSAVTYTYDQGLNGKGRRTGMTDSSGSTSWDYDPAGQVLTETQAIAGQSYVTGYRYDALRSGPNGPGRLERMIYPDGEVVTTTYNTQGLPETVTGQDVYLSHAGYNVLGQPTGWALGGVLTQSLTYDPISTRIQGLGAVNAGGVTLQDLSFSFDPLGHLDVYTDLGRDFSLDHAYDPLDRLTDVASSLYPQDYDYDPIGNLTRRGGVDLTYADPTRPHAVSATSDGTTYAYDANGNLTTKVLTGGQVVTYTYDAENRLTQVVSDAGSSLLTTSFVYDGDGGQVEGSTSDGQKTTYIGDYFEQQMEDGIDLSWTFDGSAENWLLVCDLLRCEPESYINWSGVDGNPSPGSIRTHSVYWSEQQGVFPYTWMDKGLSGYYISSNSELSFRYRIENNTGNQIHIWGRSGGATVYNQYVSGNTNGWITATVSLSSYAGREGYDIEFFIFLQSYTQFDCDVYIDSVSITNLQTGSGIPRTKHYYAGGQPLATRVDDVLYYILPDPTGTSLVMTKANGDEVGHVLYDGYGAVLTSTLPATLTTTLAGSGDMPDPDTGLVYLGAGRWYDPALGRPLQPNPIGGPPALPQALNRYSATPWGAPGVAEGALSSLPPVVGAFGRQLPGAALSVQGIPQLAQLLTRPIMKTVPIDTGIIEIVGPRASVRFLEAEGFETLAVQPASGLLRGPLSRIFKGLQTQTLRGRMGIAGALAANPAFAEGESISLGRGVTARLVARDIGYTVDELATQAAARRLANTLGVGVAGILSAGFQYASDYGNPYLAGQQKLNRALISGGLGVAASGLGLGAELLLIGSAGGPIGIIVAIPIAVIFEQALAPMIFQFTGDVPQRNLAPLSQN
jgi:YD repeat-containing protein